MHGTETSVLVPQLDVCGKLIRPGTAASSGVVWRAWPFRPQLAARAVSPTTSTTRIGRVRALMRGPGAASSPIGWRGLTAPLRSAATTLPVDHSTLAGVIR